MGSASAAIAAAEAAASALSITVFVIDVGHQDLLRLVPSGPSSQDVDLAGGAHLLGSSVSTSGSVTESVGRGRRHGGTLSAGGSGSVQPGKPTHHRDRPGQGSVAASDFKLDAEDTPTTMAALRKQQGRSGSHRQHSHKHRDGSDAGQDREAEQDTGATGRRHRRRHRGQVEAGQGIGEGIGEDGLAPAGMPRSATAPVLFPSIAAK
jgi:hypothetical protein